MQLCNHFFSLQIQKPPFHRTLFFKTPKRRPKLILSFTNSTDSRSLQLAQTLQAETLETLEWSSLCKQLSPFTSTFMGLSVTENAQIPIGETLEESQRLLDQTTAALAVMEVMESRPLNLSGIEDVSRIVVSAVSGELLSVRELCAVRRTLIAARAAWEKLEETAALCGDSAERYSTILEILRSCNFQMQLEQKIGFCIDCNLSIILDRASEELEIIRAERKRNMENLDSLLKEVSTQIFQAGGIDRPLITKRRSRLCVGIRASHKYLLPGGVLLNVSSSGATYFLEPKEAVELNNMEVRLANMEKVEEMTILSLLTAEIAESEIGIKYLLDRILEVDLAFARAAYAQWMNAVCPILSSEANHTLSVDFEGIQHPLLLGFSLSSPDVLAHNSENPPQLDEGNGIVTAETSSKGFSDFPVPIDIKVDRGTRVLVISGPNAGGKTASMKTLGLASLMSKAGMYLPAKKHPRLPWFDLVLADIGDHQSLEQNLSTFSGHISRLCEIFEVASKESLILVDEICSGTDPSEGVALAASILQYLKDHVNLAVVTTHYSDLSCLKEKDTRFQNAAMEFSLETFQPTFRILWGHAGDSNALSIAKSIGFDRNIIECAEKWVEKLRPEKQHERRGFLYESLMEERNKLEVQAWRAASLHAEILDLYNEIHEEAKDLERRVSLLKANETQQVEQELKAAKFEIESVVQDFENELKTASPDQYISLIRKSESAIASIVKAHRPKESSSVTEADMNYVPQSGEQIRVKGLRDKLVTVVEVPENETILVQYGKVKVRVKKSDIRSVPGSQSNGGTSAVPGLRKERSRKFQTHSKDNKDEELSYGPAVQTSKNTVDLRGMRLEEAAHHLNMAISGRHSQSVLFVVHGMGTGVVKECALEILRNHPRVTKYEQESPVNYGCTVAYIK